MSERPKAVPCIINEYGHQLYGTKFQFHNMPDLMAETRELRQRIKDCEGAITRREQMLEQAEAQVAELERVIFETQYDHSPASILRKQAEAVEAEAKEWREINNKHLTRGFSPDFVADEIDQRAKHLRQQADEIESGN